MVTSLEVRSAYFFTSDTVQYTVRQAGYIDSKLPKVDNVARIFTQISNGYGLTYRFRQ